ncbi:class I SAM-dependent methyltransferase [Paracoccus laeviglucosivorans]|uniref:Methyltransferase domain-containing protein n=1 Tax=Paracoccus laeviglucosivorans TaxID=1197861 RepID=A0A521D5Y2_9RHOB|nr:class I SAM-dependent methyltransferase [Paracoccus laeviglucosivorans]SMO67089.1 Methyltransferase domain-containing protein [Paracoccus laeviglucosivorans]
MDDSNGWDASAEAWIADMGDSGDFSRRHVLDRPMLARVGQVGTALDVGCGEGRFCRMLAARGIRTTGIDPTQRLIQTARERHPEGRYLEARAEALPFDDASFDLVVSYLTLIDIDDSDAAIAEMARVLRPGGRLLVANLNSFSTAGQWAGERTSPRGYLIDNYLEPRAEWVSWRGIMIRNWHRPLHHYMQALLANGLRLTHFDEPQPVDGDPQLVARYKRAPYHHVMEWEKPA